GLPGIPGTYALDLPAAGLGRGGGSRAGLAREAGASDLAAHTFLRDLRPRRGPAGTPGAWRRADDRRHGRRRWAGLGVLHRACVRARPAGQPNADLHVLGAGAADDGSADLQFTTGARSNPRPSRG